MATPISAGDTGWILTSSAMVLLMTPGLAFFYGGMVRKKNILSTLNLSFIMMGLIGVQWVLLRLQPGLWQKRVRHGGRFEFPGLQPA